MAVLRTLFLYLGKEFVNVDAFEGAKCALGSRPCAFRIVVGERIHAFADDAIARASSGLTVAPESRKSRTTISLPMPFILAKEWLASVLMIPAYMANADGLDQSSARSGRNASRLPSLERMSHRRGGS